MKYITIIFLSLFAFVGETNAQTGVSPYDSLETAMLLPLKNITEKEFTTLSNDSTNSEGMLPNPSCGLPQFGIRDFFLCTINTSDQSEDISFQFKNMSPDVEYYFQVLDSDTTEILCVGPLFENAIFGVLDVAVNDTLYGRIWDNEIDQLDTSNVDIAIFSPSAPLPVILDEYTITSDKERTVTANWTTASEVNFSHFRIEESQYGSNFTTLKDSIQSKTFEYEFIHTYEKYEVQPEMYYRLVSVDLDGYTEIFDIKTVYFDVLEVFRIINDGSMRIGNISDDDITLDVQVFSMNGQMIREQSLSVNEETNAYQMNLHNGMYTINIYDGIHLLYAEILSVRGRYINRGKDPSL